MTIEDLSASMHDAVTKILDKVKDESSIYNVNFLFTSPSVPELKVQTCSGGAQINSFTIKQDFVRNYTDVMTAEIELLRDPYVVMYHARKDLHCRIQLKRMMSDKSDGEKSASVMDNEKEITLNFKCAITKYVDIFEAVPAGKMYSEYNDGRQEHDRDRRHIPMTIEFIPEDVYCARKNEFYGIYTGVTMAGMIQKAVNYFGFKRAFVAPPDNTFNYTNFVVPPAIGVESIMGFYQTAPGLGVYNNGFCSYITRWWKDLETSCWFVWPRYGKRSTENPIHVYSVGQHTVEGQKQLHMIDETSGISILCPNGFRTKNWSEMGTENAPTAYNIQASDAIMDGTRELIADGDFDALPVTQIIAGTPTDPVDTENFVKMEYLRGKSNHYALQSDLRAFQNTTVSFDWDMAQLWSFTPATEVQLHYEHPLGFKTFCGLVESVTYTITRDPAARWDTMFLCRAHVEVNCDNVVNGQAHV